MGWRSDRRARRQARLAAFILALPEDEHYSADLWLCTGVSARIMYPWLHSAVASGWLADGWGDPTNGLPARRWYRATNAGRVALADMLRNVR